MGVVRPTRAFQVAAYAREVFEETGSPPSYSMIMDALRITDRATVRQYVVQAEALGLLVREGETRGGRLPRRGQRIRLGTPEDVEVRQVIMRGRDRG